MPTGWGIWVDWTENRQMVLESYRAEKRDELETPFSPQRQQQSSVYGDEHDSWEETWGTSLDGTLVSW